MALPNTRVQRTRSSASPPHSPLTRSPLGGLGSMSRRMIEPILLTAALLGAARCPGSEGRKFLLDESARGRWIVMEYLNPSCSPLSETDRARDVRISASGYACTSSPMESGPSISSIYVLQADGTKRELRPDEIQLPQSINGPLELIGAGGKVEKRCNFVAEGFWYGPRGSVQGRMIDALRAHHPECP
jgi:hypothetical protein